MRSTATRVPNGETDPMADPYLQLDGDRREQLLDELARLVIVAKPRLPQPGHQAAFLDAMGVAEPSGVEAQAGLAMRRLIDGGATTEDLYAIARDIVAWTIMDVLEVLSPEDGAFAGELYRVYDEQEIDPER
jgi:hypothetical protein